MRRFSTRLLFSLLYLGILMFVTGVLLYRLLAFDGILVVEKHRAERWAVRPADEGGFFSMIRRSFPAELIGFDNPRTAVRVLGPEESFHALRLPFALYLHAVDVLESPPDKDVLEVVHSGTRLVMDADAGTTLDIPEGRVLVQGVEPWVGLVRAGQGAPMAMISLKMNDDAWLPQIFVAADGSIRPAPEVMVLMRHFQDESTARAAPVGRAAERQAVRWAIRDAGRIHWFETLVPGTGVTTSEGVEYTLLDVVESDTGGISHILVGRRDGARSIIQQIAANAESPDGTVLFECLNNAIVILLRIWRDGAALVALHAEGAQLAESLLAERETLDAEMPDGTMIALRLDQVMTSAVAVHASPDGVTALVLDTPGGTMQLREGMSEQITETRVRYRRLPQPPRVAYTLRALSGGEEAPRQFVLVPGESKRLGGWRFIHDQEHIGAASVAVLRVKRAPGTLIQYLGLLCFVLGAGGISIMRFGYRRRGLHDLDSLESDGAWVEIDPGQEWDSTPANNDGHSPPNDIEKEGVP